MQADFCCMQRSACKLRMQQGLSFGRVMSIKYLGAVLGAGFCQALDNASIDVEQVITSHARLAGHSSRDDNQVRIFQGSTQALLSRMPGHLNDTVVSARFCFLKGIPFV